MKNKIITIMFIVYLLVFSLGSIIAKDREFSEMENRNLTTFSSPSVDKVLSGEYSDYFEKYMNDQLIFKDELVKLKVTENRSLNQRKINGVYFSKDNMLIQEYNNPYNQLTKNVAYINEFADGNQDKRFTWLIVPNTCYVYEDKLPAYADVYDQGEVLAYIKSSVSDRICVADCSDELISNKSEYIYYNTDHHWTMNGAYIGYKVLCDKLGIESNGKDMYNIENVNDEFLGSQYSNAPTFNQKKDSIIRYSYQGGEYTVEYEDTNQTVSSLYSEACLGEKDKYKYYLDGNHSLIHIKSNALSGDNGKLLIIKDSYAHSLIPLLAEHYSEIYVVDLRYYHSSLSDFANEKGIDNIVLINNIEFLSTDDNFLWLQ